MRVSLRLLAPAAGLLQALAVGLAASPALAETAAPPDKGDTAWMLVATALVVLMTVPGLALFYGGLVRAKNMLSVLMQVLYTLCVVAVLWLVVGYSLAFSPGGALNPLIGGLSKVLLLGVTPASTVETFSKGVLLPEMAFLAFQLTFAAITPALIVGSLAERMRFPALAVFIPLWSLLVYCPIAHMVWFWGGPSAPAEPAGLAFQLGAIDFAGGTVVHINGGVAGLVGALVLGRRLGYGREALTPHSLTMTLIGTGLLWAGWFGFNAGSALEASGSAALAFLNTLIAPAAAGLGWMLAEQVTKGKASLLGAASGVVAGLVAITPAAGYAGPAGALVLGLLVSPICLYFCSSVKARLGYDDALDVFGVHGVGGIVGAVATGVLAAPALGGVGLWDYTTGAPAGYDMTRQVLAQLEAVALTLAWSGLVSAGLFWLIDASIGLRVAGEEEREGLDLVDHGERAYSA